LAQFSDPLALRTNAVEPGDAKRPGQKAERADDHHGEDDERHVEQESHGA
jgi:hypothetical protein